jgi:thiol-disulfide isomerase/thioredoxin
MTTRFRPTRLAPLALALAGGMLIAAAPNVGRETDNKQREQIAAMEGKPFDASALATLDAWVGGEVITPDAMPEGHVVAFAFVDVTNPAAMTALNTLARLSRTDAEKGLTVFAVHPEAGYEEIERLAGDNRIRVPVAKDVGDAFRAAMHADDTPDLFVIDRAGQLRFADIETRSLSVAVYALLKETAEEAVANAASETAAPTRTAGSGPSAKPDADEKRRPATPADYAAASWPAFNTGSLNATDVQGKALPAPLGGETWLTPQQNLAGKVIVLDFWATWCGPCHAIVPTLEQIQTANPDKLAILGVSGQGDDLSKVRSFLSNKQTVYGHLFDQNQRVYRALQVRAIPHVVVLSTDGVVRWQGNPHEPSFRAAVDQILRADPGL